MAKLYEKHSSQAFNPSIANAFFRAGDIEAWLNVQQMFNTSRVTALRLLSSLDEYIVLEGGKGKESYYTMKEY